MEKQLGRPVGSGKYYEQITFSLSPELLQRIKQRARERGIPRAEFIREAIEFELKYDVKMIEGQ